MGLGTKSFYGWRVVYAALVLAVFGWGIGFYGPPVFLSVIHETRGWSLLLISAAVSVHFLLGAVTGANLPALHRRFGATRATQAGALSMAAGIIGWALAQVPWHMFVAAMLTGAGWGTMSAAALNIIVSPWFVRTRPAALSMAYNGGSIGGIIFSPLWVMAIAGAGFAPAASLIAAVMVLTVWLLAARVFSRTPAALGQRPDGDAQGVVEANVTSPLARPLPGRLLWRDRRFVTLAAGMTLGLFVQIGLTAHLYSLLVPALGAQAAGWAMGLMTLMAITGRTLLGWLMPPGADRRLVACGGYVLQMSGCVALLLAGGSSVPMLIAGVVLFGLGFGTAVSLPPLIAQVEFVKEEVPRVASLIVGIAQGGYAIAPACFGALREFAPAAVSAAGSAPAVFAVAALVDMLAVGAFLAGRRRSRAGAHPA